MDDMLHRPQPAARAPVSGLAVRAIGCLLLVLCAAAAWWLFRSVHTPPAHPTRPSELLAGFLTVVCWAGGWAALGEGEGLFRRVVVPARHARFDPVRQGMDR